MWHQPCWWRKGTSYIHIGCGDDGVITDNGDTRSEILNYLKANKGSEDRNQVREFLATQASSMEPGIGRSGIRPIIQGRQTTVVRTSIAVKE